MDSEHQVIDCRWFSQAHLSHRTIHEGNVCVGKQRRSHTACYLAGFHSGLCSRERGCRKCHQPGGPVSDIPRHSQELHHRRRHGGCGAVLHHQPAVCDCRDDPPPAFHRSDRGCSSRVLHGEVPRLGITKKQPSIFECRLQHDGALHIQQNCTSHQKATIYLYKQTEA